MVLPKLKGEASVQMISPGAQPGIYWPWHPSRILNGPNDLGDSRVCSRAQFLLL